MNIARYARALADALLFKRDEAKPKPKPKELGQWAGPQTGTEAIGRWADSKTGRFIEPPVKYIGPESQAFRAVIESDPLNPTHHFAYSDWLRDHDKEVEADFHKALGEWLPEGFPAARGDSPYPFSIKTPQLLTDNTFTPDPVLPAGLEVKDLPGHYTGYSTNHTNSRSQFLPAYASGPGVLHWPSMPAMIDGLKMAYFTRIARNQNKQASG